MEQICDDLAAEHDALDAIVAPIPDVEWERSTPAEGWSIRDAISHLWYFDGVARQSATDSEAFVESRGRLLGSGRADEDFSVIVGASLPAGELLANWRRDREQLVSVLRALDPKTRLEWFGPSMGARSFATARLMETWAHGQDIVDALGVTRRATMRLRHVAHIGVGARPFSYAVRDLAVPVGDVRVELAAPDGSRWLWGTSTTDVVSGDALDFCLVVTQRRHLDDVSLDISGPGAVEWMAIAQAFAGGPGAGRSSGQFASTTDR